MDATPLLLAHPAGTALASRVTTDRVIQRLNEAELRNESLEISQQLAAHCKKKGVAQLRLPDGSMAMAEVHWYEAHGIGKVKLKIKEWL